MNTIRKYIIIDDDPLNNMLCNMTIKKALGDADTETFTKPEEGLAFIQSNYSSLCVPTILFLDINMPTITGWEFMEKYKRLSDDVQSQITIYIVSSSVSQEDKDKAKADKYIKGFLSKPIGVSTIDLISKDITYG